MRFAAPWFLLLLVIIPPLVWWHLRGRVGRGPSLQFSAVSTLGRTEGYRVVAHRYGLFSLRVAALLLIIVALARPQFGSRFEEIVTEGIDIVLALDVSTSMKAEDFQPLNRLNVAKEVAKQFIEGRRNDRIGMVVFAAKSITQCPLTLDYGVLLSLLDGIDFGMIEDGTAIGMGLGTCLARLRESEAKSKIIILLTDGVNNRGQIDPLTAAQMARTLGVKIYAIGAGTRGTAPYPVDDGIFGKRYVQVPVELDEEMLTEVAAITGGRYFRATDAHRLEEIYEEISEMEKTRIESREYVEYSERFRWLAIPALVLILAEVVLSNTILRKIP
ncbi:aerotolerance regulator BatA [candidate division TA06 bacterium DG_24]|jgi:Ca-activated chloride channel family protein|uniref:Aerotolerance regulator BatA n=3 Tax=Bacteria division TA06 TaxID=1156500 RepID=A0A0S8JP04_UNCT6|nr:MAG: aerotolerance regulator BatA [candidate division TA06 bacterium DG_24]KPK70657.1 MAG: aerotolerance regulator BatA [candidate division TA06 bacterium SM23_40]KPL10947.1 MAG: aerotolerance regulator BatA [candidate division TA06 bacterium SM1_40]